jgi:hypothetical protein
MKRHKIVYQKITLPIVFDSSAMKGSWRFVEGRVEPRWVEQYTYWEDFISVDDVSKQRHLRMSEEDRRALLSLPSGELRRRIEKDVLGDHEEFERRLNENQWGWEDPWELVQEFLAVRTDLDLLEFLQSTGHFCNPIVPDAMRQDRYDPAELQQPTTAFWELQEILARIIKRREVVPDLNKSKLPEHWKLTFLSSVGLQFENRFRALGARISTEDTLQAMLAVTRIRVLSGAKFRFCARPDCHRPFEIMSNHERDCCTHTCAHVHWQRRKRGTRAKVLDERKRFGYGKY